MIAECCCGVDIQKTETTLEKVKNRFCSNKELKLLQQATDSSKDTLLTLLWCAKEATKKAASISQTMLGFLELELIDIVPHGNIFTTTFKATKIINSMPETYTTRAGYVNGYGVACCLVTDLPQHIWEKRNA